MPVREAFFPTQRRPRTYTTVKTRNVSSVYLVRELLDSLPLPLPRFSVFAPSPTALFFYLLLPWSTVRQIWKLKVSERCCFVLRSLSRLRWKKVSFFEFSLFLINCYPCFFFFSSFAHAPSHFRLFFFFFSHSLVSLSFFFFCVCVLASITCCASSLFLVIHHWEDWRASSVKGDSSFTSGIVQKSVSKRREGKGDKASFFPLRFYHICSNNNNKKKKNQKVCTSSP